jgi:Ca-activated chloride channel family protein
MLVEDILPNRLEVAKKIILDSINKIDRDLGIIVFAAEAYTFLPITSDRELATTFLESIDSNYIAPGATNISKALLLANEDGRDKVVVVLTDGEDSYMDAKQYVNNRTFFVAVGTKNGGPIPFQGGYLKNENNSNVISKINYTYLNSLGRTYSLVGVGRDLKDLTSDISKILDYFDSKSMDYERYYQIFLAISIIFFLFGYFAKSFKD